MNKARSRQEQSVALARVSAAVRLQGKRPQAHADKKRYDRNKEKRLWQNRPDGAFAMVSQQRPTPRGRPPRCTPGMGTGFMG